MRQTKRLLSRGLAVSGLALGLCACGGRSEQTWIDATPGADALDPAPGAASGGSVAGPPAVSYAAGGSQSLPDRGPASAGAAHDACEAGPSSLRAELVWERGAGLYGIMDAPFFAFSPTGTELLTPAEEYGRRGNVVYSVADGSPLPQNQARVLGRDAAWSRELRGANELGPPGALSVVDLQLEQVLLSLPEVPYFGRLSADGKYVVGLYCQDTPRLEKRRISDGDVTTLDLQGDTNPCNGANYGGSTPFSVGSSSDSVVFPTSHGSELALASIAAGTASAHAIYEPVPDTSAWPPTDLLLTLALSPSERRLATVDGMGTLRVWSYPELVQSLPDIKLVVTHAFNNCYCTPGSFAPVAWSPDERLLATADEASSIVVRRACDGSVLATIAAPTAATSDTAGPAFMAFSPDGTGLAVLFLPATYGGTVSYYRLAQ